MTKAEIVEHLKRLGLKGNVQESKKVLEARLEEATIKTVKKVEIQGIEPDLIIIDEEPEYQREYFSEIVNLEEGLVKATKVIRVSTPPKGRYIGKHPVTGEKLYR